MSQGVLVLGAAGRMGRTIVRLLLEGAVEELVLSGAMESESHPGVGQDAGLMAGASPCSTLIAGDFSLASADAAVGIDFSFHEATAAHATQMAEAGKPLVIGTTGLTGKELSDVHQAATSVPIVMAPNMSLGVNLLFCLAEAAATALKDRGYDIEIEERHHRLKKDAPSGTALGLGEAVAKGLGVNLENVAIHGREGMVGERTDDEIGFHATRGGDIVGDHTVLFATSGEIVELSHRATSRDTFAIGALRAAAWVIGQPPGMYSMRDVLAL